MGYSLWGHKELDTTEATEHTEALGLNKHQFNWESEALGEKPRIEEALCCPLKRNSAGCTNHRSVH